MPTKQQNFEESLKKINSGLDGMDVSLDTRINEMDANVRKQYFMKARDLMENPVIWDILKDAERIIKEAVVQMEDPTKEEFIAYRMLLHILKNKLPEKIRGYSGKYKEPEVPTKGIEVLKEKI